LCHSHIINPKHERQYYILLPGCAGSNQSHAETETERFHPDRTACDHRIIAILAAMFWPAPSAGHKQMTLANLMYSNDFRHFIPDFSPSGSWFINLTSYYANDVIQFLMIVSIFPFPAGRAVSHAPINITLNPHIHSNDGSLAQA
jgi:hypothetical protein